MQILLNKDPLVSVLIDTYNYGRFIEEAIDSILKQTFPQKDLEIIVVDDGSTDDTSERVRKYKDKVKYVYKENGGQASAFNIGFEIARGEYIILLDSDDLCMPTRIEKIVEEFENYKGVGCVLNTRKINFNNQTIKESFPNFHNLEIGEKNIDFFINSSYGTSRTSLRKSILKYILPIPSALRIEADLYLNLSIIWFCNLSCLNEELTFYRIHGENSFCITDLKRLPLQIQTMELALKAVRSVVKNSDKYDEHLLNTLLKRYETEVKEKEFALGSCEGIRSEEH